MVPPEPSVEGISSPAVVARTGDGPDFSGHQQKAEDQSGNAQSHRILLKGRFRGFLGLWYMENNLVHSSELLPRKARG